MLKHIFFTSTSTFEKDFQRCCKQYQQLDMYVAWIGNPLAVIPFEYLQNVIKLNAVVGASFCQTHPEGIQYLLDLKATVQIAKEEVLYHPKVYIFTNKEKKAIFIGSSNFTYHGFYKNHETNILFEGSANDYVIAGLEREMKKYWTKEFSFDPDEGWLSAYRDRYEKHRQKIKDAGFEDEAEKEEDIISSASWLAVATWDVYLKQFRAGLVVHEKSFGEGLREMIYSFDLYGVELATPWTIELFEERERRKMLGGMYQYGWLGHVGASGDFRRMLANGTKHEKNTMISEINYVASLSAPLNYGKLTKSLDKLVALGATMKVWGRLLAIVRPDLFCTISAPQVRRSLSKLINIPNNRFETVEGYLTLIKLIHSSPWFNSKQPSSKKDLEIWRRRAAFLDVVFYN